MFYYDENEYDTMYVNKSGIYLSRKIDGHEYVRDIKNINEFEQIKVSSNLSVKGISELYSNMDDYEKVIHELYDALTKNSNADN